MIPLPAFMLLRSVALALALAGSAAERPRLQLWPLAPLDDEAGIASVDPRFELRPRAELEARLSAVRAPFARDEYARLAAVDTALDRIREAYLEQRWDDMEREALALEAAELPLIADPRRCASLWELELRLVLVYLSRNLPGDQERATERIAFALALDPDRRPARDVYGPDVVGAFVSVSERVSARAIRNVSIARMPEDARVAVDCRDLPDGGVADLRPGLHVIHGRAAGHLPAAKIVRIADDPRPEITLAEGQGDAIERLARSLDADEIDPRRGADRRALTAAAVADGSAGMVIVWPSGERFSARIVLGARSGPTVVAADVEAAIRLALAQLDAKGRFVAPSITAAPRAPADTGKPKAGIVRKWWFWTVLGVVVVGSVATGLALGLREHPDQRLQIYAR